MKNLQVQHETCQLLSPSGKSWEETKRLAPPNAFSRKGHFKGLRAEALAENPQRVAIIARPEGIQAQALGGAPGTLLLSANAPIKHSARRTSALLLSQEPIHPRHVGRPGPGSHVLQPAARSSHAAPGKSLAALAGARPGSRTA